jgi:predicted MFS family arabinose efflux permease
MGEHRSSPLVLLVILSAAVFLVRTVWLMLGPLLVELATEFQTSVAVTGQLAAAIGLSWGITAPLIGPVSDTYGRRRIGLTGLMIMAIGTLGSVCAWSYGALLACRLLTVIGTPLVALLGELGGWRLPFYGVGALLIAVWGLQWCWLPRRPRASGPSLAFLAHFREASQHTGIWYVLGANVLYQSAAVGLFTYLAASLRRTYGLTGGETVVPLALVGLGAMGGSLLGGRVASHGHRLVLAATALWIGGITGGLAFIMTATP